MSKLNLSVSLSLYHRKYLNHANRLDCSQERVEHFSKDDESSLRSFAKFVNSGLSPKETLTLNSIVAVKKSLLSLSGRLSKHACG